VPDFRGANAIRASRRWRPSLAELNISGSTEPERVTGTGVGGPVWRSWCFPVRGRVYSEEETLAKTP
jgi:hypothetical protein